VQPYAKDVEEQASPREISRSSKSERKTTAQRERNGSWRGVTQDVIKSHKSSLRICELILANPGGERDARGEFSQRFLPNASAACSWNSGWWWP